MVSRSFFLFAVSGALAFLIDGGVVQALVSLAGSDPYLARGFSFLCAVTFTWAFNRRYTFVHGRDQPAWPQWRRYVATQLGGFAVNYAVYALMVAWLPFVRAWPIVGVAAGSVAGLLVNYAAAKRLVFKPPV